MVKGNVLLKESFTVKS